MSNVSKGQIQLPDDFHSGEALKADDLERMRQAIAFTLKDMISGGNGITVTHSAGRYIISARKQRGGGRADKNPFKIKLVDPEERTVTVGVGKVNNTIPTINGTRLIASPEPKLTIPNNPIVGVYIKVEVDGSMEATDISIIAAEIDTISNSLDLQTGGIGYDLIGFVDVEDGAITRVRQVLDSNIYHRAYLKHIFWT